MSFAGRFEGIRIFECSFMGKGAASAGLALPGIGIFVGREVFDNESAVYLLMHEYGHILQARAYGWVKFYGFIGLLSLCSAITDGFGGRHKNYWTERWANHLSKQYFEIDRWPLLHYPVGLPPASIKRFLGSAD